MVDMVATYDIEQINSEHKTRFSELINQYGSYLSIPKSEIDLWTETTRTLYIMHSHPEADASLLRQYGVPAILIERFTGDDGAIEKKSRRADKYKAMLNWCSDNVGVQVTPDELAEIGDVSRATSLKFIQDRVDLFRKVKRGVYEVRDPETERAADK